MPSPSNALASPALRSGQVDLLYSAAATPFSSRAPSATWPVPSRLASGTELARTIMARSLAAAVCTDPGLTPSPRGAAGRGQAPRGERAERHGEPFGLGDVGLQGRRVRVHRAVQDQGPDPVREQLGVPGAQVGAVGLAQVGEPGLAERGAEHVHVPGRVLGADVRQQRPGVLLAPLRVQLGLRDDRGQFGRAGGHLVGAQVPVQLRAGQAGQRGLAAGDAARVEADDVEPGQQRGRNSLRAASAYCTPEPPGPRG